MKGLRFLRDLPRVFPYLRPYWKLALGSVLMVVASVFAGLLAPWPLAILVDTVLGTKPLPSLLGFLGEWDRTTLLVVAVVSGLLITAFQSGLSVLDNYVNTKLDQKMVLDFRSDLFEHAQRLSLAFHNEQTKGGLMYAINLQAASVGQVVVALAPLAQSAAMLVAMFGVAYRIDPQLALLSLTVVPFVYYSTGYYATRIEPRLYHVRGLEGQSLAIVHEAMAMIRVILSFGREPYEFRRFREQGERALEARVDLTVRQTAFSLAVNVITAAGSALVLGLGAWHVLDDRLTVGELLVVMGYVAAVYQPLRSISATIAALQEHFINLRSSLDLLDTEPEIKDAPDAVPLAGRAAGHVAYEGVHFAYAGREATLTDISFEVEAGQAVAIVGPTGAGKSTLVSLLPRFYDPERGRILLDGTDIRKLTVESLRRQISIVLQEPLLFSGTIADNIRYGRLEATMEEIVEAAKAANADAFIGGLPDGYDTELGEGGPQLSGGERQRLAVARAFLKDAPILILDEPTSSIDSKTEAVILEALDRLMVGRTTFTIAHRLSTVRGADLILVLDQGRLVERGTHEELLQQDGVYKQLHDAQAPGLRAKVGAVAATAHRGGPGLLPRLRELVHEFGDGNGKRSGEAPAAARGLASERMDQASRRADTVAPAWSLLAAARPLVEEGSTDALRRLAMRRDDPSPDVRTAAELAEAVLRDVELGNESGEGHR